MGWWRGGGEWRCKKERYCNNYDDYVHNANLPCQPLIARQSTSQSHMSVPDQKRKLEIDWVRLPGEQKLAIELFETSREC